MVLASWFMVKDEVDKVWHTIAVMVDDVAGLMALTKPAHRGCGSGRWHCKRDDTVVDAAGHFGFFFGFHT
jgi:hypothetical protein